MQHHVSQPSAEAASVPLDPITVGGHVLRPMSLADAILLKRVNSPFVNAGGKPPASPARTGRGAPAVAPEPKRFPELATLGVVYLLTRPAEVLDRWFFEGMDPDKFNREVWAFSNTLPLGVLVGLEEKIREMIRRATASAAA